MHEFALAEAVLAAAVATADDRGIDCLQRVCVRIGALQQIERETFEFCLREVRPQHEARLQDTAIELEVEPARFRCRICKQGFGVEEANPNLTKDESEAVHFIPELAHAFLRCPSCGSSDFEITAGRGITLVSIEGTPRHP